MTDTTLGLPTPLVDGLLGAIIGGLLSIVGGFLASLYVAGQDDKRERERLARDDQARLDDLAASVRMVRYELATNATSLDFYLQFGRLSHDLSDAVYRSVQLLLARRLPQDLRVKVIHAYNMFPFATENIAALQAGTAKDAAKTTAVIASVRDDFADACEALRFYLVDVMRVAEA